LANTLQRLLRNFISFYHQAYRTAVWCSRQYVCGFDYGQPSLAQPARRADMNQQWILARTPLGGLPTDDDFKLVQAPIPQPGPHQMLTRTIYLSLDPYQWGRKRSGVEAVGEVCHGRTVSQVVKSNLSEYKAGDFLFNTNGWQEYGLTGGGISVFEYMFPRQLDPAQAPISTAVGIMGMLGLTAYAGMVLQCKPQAGETAVAAQPACTHQPLWTHVAI
jgi:NADPH-dependent curcumin reductase